MAADRGACDEPLIIQFARSPQPGSVKTRMLSALSPQQACELHQELLLWTCRELCSANIGPVELWVAGDVAHPVFEQCQNHGVRRIVSQSGENLGERMCHAVEDGLRRFRQVILVGSDCPSIDLEYLRQARETLQSYSIVLGPADDGGYVLLGANRLVPEMFAGIDWGTGSVFDETVITLESLEVDWAALESLPDIDRPEDLPVWQVLKRRDTAAH